MARRDPGILVSCNIAGQQFEPSWQKPWLCVLGTGQGTMQILLLSVAWLRNGSKYVQRKGCSIAQQEWICVVAFTCAFCWLPL